MHPGTLVIHENIYQTKLMNCGSQAALHPPERKRKHVTTLLSKKRERKREGEDGRS
jgi:hypothetical protein